MHTIKINKKVTIAIPDGSLCHRPDQDPNSKSCQFLLICNKTTGHRNGISPIDHYDCSLFQEKLKTEIGIGVHKCKNCVSITEGSDAHDKN